MEQGELSWKLDPEAMRVKTETVDKLQAPFVQELVSFVEKAQDILNSLSYQQCSFNVKRKREYLREFEKFKYTIQEDIIKFSKKDVSVDEILMLMKAAEDIIRDLEGTAQLNYIIQHDLRRFIEYIKKKFEVKHDNSIQAPPPNSIIT